MRQFTIKGPVSDFVVKPETRGRLRLDVAHFKIGEEIFEYTYYGNALKINRQFELKNLKNITLIARKRKNNLNYVYAIYLDQTDILSSKPYISNIIIGLIFFIMSIISIYFALFKIYPSHDPIKNSLYLLIIALTFIITAFSSLLVGINQYIANRKMNYKIKMINNNYSDS